MRLLNAAVAVCVALTGTSVALAQDSASSAKADAGGAAVAGPGKSEDDPSKFFWFHKADTPIAVAKADIGYCLAQTGNIWPAQKPNYGQGGLIGALVTGILNGITEGVEARRMRDAGMRKCMGLFGYQRYRVAEPEWNAMMRAADAVDRLSLWASGPAPTTQKLEI